MRCRVLRMSVVNSGKERRTEVSTKADAPVRKSLAQLGMTQLPAGNYAMKWLATGQVHFFRVSYGNPRGRWAGYTFLEELSGDNRIKIRDAQKRAEIINAICCDPLGYLALYGKEIGKCGVCGRTLTSEWRLRGIGPECFKNYGSPE